MIASSWNGHKSLSHPKALLPFSFLNSPTTSEVVSNLCCSTSSPPQIPRSELLSSLHKVSAAVSWVPMGIFFQDRDHQNVAHFLGLRWLSPHYYHAQMMNWMEHHLHQCLIHYEIQVHDFHPGQRPLQDFLLATQSPRFSELTSPLSVW